MSAPVTPSEIEATLATTSGGACDRLLRALFTFPAKFHQIYAWAFNEDGTLSTALKQELCALDCTAIGVATIAAPTLTRSATVSGSSTLSWGAVIGAAYYELVRATGINNVNEGSLRKATTLLNYADTTVDDTWYHYWVRGRTAASVGAWSPVCTSYSSAAPPLVLSAPSLATTTTLPDFVTVSWSAIAGATSYQIRRNTANNFAAATVLGTTSTLFYDDFNGAFGVSYYYFAMATNALANSAGSTGVVGLRT